MFASLLHSVNKLSHRQWLGLFLLLTLPMLFSPFMTDDFFHLLMLSETPPVAHTDTLSLWGLFSFIDDTSASRNVLMQSGVLPWWVSDEFYFKFWRPLAELTHRVDYTLAPANPWVAHLHSILWFIVMALCVLGVYTQLGVQRKVALLAFVLFLLDGNHGATITWVANRNALLAGVFAFCAFAAHVRWRQGYGFHHNLLGLFLFVVALLAGESALAIGAFLFAYAVTLDGGGRLKGFVSIIPYAVVVLIWLIIYKQAGYGAHGSPIHYVDMVSAPIEFLLVSLERLPVYVFSNLYLVPAEIYPGLKLLSDSSAALIFYLFVLLSLLLFFGVFRKEIQSSKLVQFALLSAILSIVPFCSIINQDRLSLIPSVGFSLLIALLIYAVYQKIGLIKLSKRKVILVNVLLVLNLVVSPLYLLALGGFKHAEASRQLTLIDSDIDVAEKHVIFMKASPVTASLYNARYLLAGEPAPASVSYISNMQGELTYRRITAHMIEVERAPSFVSGFEESFRDIKEKPLNKGAVINMGQYTIMISNVDAEGRVEKILLMFGKSVDIDKEFVFMHQGRDKLHQLAPMQIGQIYKL